MFPIKLFKSCQSLYSGSLHTIANNVVRRRYWLMYQCILLPLKLEQQVIECVWKFWLTTRMDVWVFKNGNIWFPGIRTAFCIFFHHSNSKTHHTADKGFIFFSFNSYYHGDGCCEQPIENVIGNETQNSLNSGEKQLFSQRYQENGLCKRCWPLKFLNLFPKIVMRMLSWVNTCSKLKSWTSCGRVYFTCFF